MKYFDTLNEANALQTTQMNHCAIMSAHTLTNQKKKREEKNHAKRRMERTYWCLCTILTDDDVNAQREHAPDRSKETPRTAKN